MAELNLNEIQGVSDASQVETIIISPRSTVCTLSLMKYAKTKKDKVEYDAGNDEERIEKVTELNKKYEDDFESTGKKIKDAEIIKIDKLDAEKRFSILSKKDQYMIEAYKDRLNKTKNDIEESTKMPYDPVKKTLSECLAELTENDESRQQKLEKEIEDAENEIDTFIDELKKILEK